MRAVRFAVNEAEKAVSVGPRHIGHSRSVHFAPTHLAVLVLVLEVVSVLVEGAEHVGDLIPVEHLVAVQVVASEEPADLLVLLGARAHHHIEQQVFTEILKVEIRSMDREHWLRQVNFTQKVCVMCVCVLYRDDIICLLDILATCN